MTKIIAHRGASGLALENSLASIKAALKMAVEAIEIDVLRTNDGQLLLAHDNFRLGLRRGSAPTLEEALKLVGAKKPLMLDIKSPDVSEELLRLLKENPSVKVFFSGRQYDELKRLRQARPDIPFLIQHHYDPMEIIHRAKGMGAKGICINMWLMNPLTYRLAKSSGLEVYVYSINHRWLLRFFQSNYPEVIVLSHHPERLL